MRRPVAIKPRRRAWVPLVLVALLVLAALFLAQLSRTTANPERVQLMAGLCAGGAAAVLLLTVLRRR